MNLMVAFPAVLPVTVSAPLLESLLLLLLILANGIFAGAEIAVVSASRTRLEQLAGRGSRGARAALRLAGSPNDFLSTVQIGITLIGILSGAVGGATLAQRLEQRLRQVEVLIPWSEALAVGLVVGAITYLSLVIGELVPKRIALGQPERFAAVVAIPMRRLSRLTAPLVRLLGLSTEGVLHLLGVRATDQPEITEEEIRALLRRGAESGVVEEVEQEMMERIFRLGDRSVRGIMTPRTEITWLDLDAPLEENLRKVMESPHTRFPVGRGSIDDCVGILRGNRLLRARLLGDPVDLESLLQPPLYVTESVRGMKVIERFRESGLHTALILDEYGGIEGLVTLNDVMEAIVGDLPTPDELEDPMIIRREDGSWLLDGLLDLGEFKQLVGRAEAALEAGGFETLGGFVMHRLGRIPRAGEHLEWSGLRLEVVDMDGKRVDKILVTPWDRPDQAADVPAGDADHG
jgi:putative hemolysin